MRSHPSLPRDLAHGSRGKAGRAFDSLVVDEHIGGCEMATEE